MVSFRGVHFLDPIVFGYFGNQPFLKHAIVTYFYWNIKYALRDVQNCIQYFYWKFWSFGCNCFMATFVIILGYSYVKLSDRVDIFYDLIVLLILFCIVICLIFHCFVRYTGFCWRSKKLPQDIFTRLFRKESKIQMTVVNMITFIFYSWLYNN